MWHRSETYWLLDRTIRIRSQSNAFSGTLESVLGHATPPHRSARAGDSYFIAVGNGRYTVYRDCIQVVETESVDRAVEFFLADLNRHILYSFGGFAAHAGVVRHPSGRLAVLPGTSGTGKSTLTAAAVLAGFEYLSDEALCVRYGETEALPYLKPINLMDWSRSHLGIDEDTVIERPISPLALGKVHRNPEIVTDIVHLDRGRTLAIERVGSNNSVGTLVQMSFNHFRDPAETFHTVTKIAAGAATWELSYDSALDAARLLFDRFN